MREGHVVDLFVDFWPNCQDFNTGVVYHDVILQPPYGLLVWRAAKTTYYTYS